MRRSFLVAMLFAAAASAAPRVQRTITPAAKGPNRVGVDVALLAGSAKPATLDDLRLRDASGHEVGYLLIAPPPPTADWRTATILPVASTKTTSGFEADLAATANVDRIEITGIAAPFLKRLRVEGGGDREHWTMLAADATIFDLPDETLRNLEVPFAPGEYRYLRVTWDDRASARVREVGGVRARVHGSGVEPPPLSAAVSFRALDSERGKSRYRLTLPGPHLPVAAIELEVDNPNVDRAAAVSEPRLSGNTVEPVQLGASTLRRAQRDGGVAADMAIKISAPEGPDLDVTVDNGSNPPLSIVGILARFAPQPWIYFESADGAPLTATYGDASLERPRYDLEASRHGAETMQVAQAAWSPANVSPQTAAAARELVMTGSPIDQKQFLYARTIGAMPRGLTSLVLDAHVLAHSAALNDVRLVDAQGDQVPYLVERRESPLALRLAVPGREKADGNRSIYHLALPYDTLPYGTQLVIRTDARVFDRDVALRKPADEAHGREAQILESTAWRSSDPESDPPPLTFTPQIANARGVDLEIDEGDNAPLRIVSAEVLVPSYALRFVSPGSPLTLLYGNPGAAPPRYDLALLAPRLFGESSREVTLASAIPSDGAGTTTRERKIFWIVIAGAALVLLLTLTRLLTGVSAGAG